MSRATEFIDFINRKKMPDEDECRVLYPHISITELMKEFRKKYRKAIKKESKCQEKG